MTSEQALQKLKEGHKRYLDGTPKHPDQTAQRRRETANEGQHPFATILACSDSREPVEIIFDEGIGDLFVVRNAGNVVDQATLGTIEYGAAALETPLIVVLGHSRCGAVTATVQNADAPVNVMKLMGFISPVVEKVRSRHGDAEASELLTESIEANVANSMRRLYDASEEIRKRVSNGTLRLVGAVYHLAGGQIDWLDIEI